MLEPETLARCASPATNSERALLLDLDGVLFDTRVVMCRAWQVVQEHHRVDVAFEDYLQRVGRPFADIMEQLGLRDAATLHATYDRASLEWDHLAPPFPGIDRGMAMTVSADDPQQLHALLLQQQTAHRGETAGQGKTSGT